MGLCPYAGGCMKFTLYQSFYRFTLLHFCDVDCFVFIQCKELFVTQFLGFFCETIGLWFLNLGKNILAQDPSS